MEEANEANEGFSDQTFLLNRSGLHLIVMITGTGFANIFLIHTYVSNDRRRYLQSLL